MHVSKCLSTFRCPHFAFVCVCAPCPSSYEVHCETESATNPVVEAAQVQQAVNPYLNPLFSSGSTTLDANSLIHWPSHLPTARFRQGPCYLESNRCEHSTTPKEPWCILPSNRYLQLQKEVGSRKFLQIWTTRYYKYHMIRCLFDEIRGHALNIGAKKAATCLGCSVFLMFGMLSKSLRIPRFGTTNIPGIVPTSSGSSGVSTSATETTLWFCDQKGEAPRTVSKRELLPAFKRLLKAAKETLDSLIL